MYYIILFILTVALWPVIAVLLAWLLLVGYYLHIVMRDFMKNIIGRIYYIFFRAMSIGGMCAVTLLTALGICASEKKDAKEAERDKK